MFAGTCSLPQQEVISWSPAPAGQYAMRADHRSKDSPPVPVTVYVAKKGDLDNWTALAADYEIDYLGAYPYENFNYP